jgi:Phage tail protein
LRRLIYENSRGDSIEFYLSPLFIDSLNGVGEVEVDLQSQKSPYQDGDTHIDAVLKPRYINLEGEIIEISAPEIKKLRRELIKLCNPKLGLGKITLEMDGDIREIIGTPDGGVVFPERGENIYQKFMITWKCSDPNWYDPKIEKRTLASFVGGFSFPFSFPLSFGEVGDFLEVENKGDVDTPVFVVFKGPLKNPVLENKTTGQKITVTQEIPAGESLEINTAFGKKSVIRVMENGTRVSAFNWVDPKSKLWQLIPGINEISYSATDEAGNAAATIYFYNRYVGV